jgi:lanthanide-dependent methanol dehydrogenase
MMRAILRLISIRCADCAARHFKADSAWRRVVPGSFAFLLLAPGLAAAQSPVPPASAAPKDDGQWTMPAKNYAATRFSELQQIDGGNVGKLAVAFTFSTGVNKGQEAAPLVVNNTMFLVTPFPNIVYALDLTKPGAPLKWSFRPHPENASQGVACCDVVNRGAAYWDGKIVFNTLDGNTIALDASSGKMLWKRKLAEINQGETITMAPLVVKGKVLVGNSGGELGVRGWVAALDVNDGKVVWKAYATGPDKDVLIGPDFHPFYPSEQGKDLGVSTWPPEAWEIGGGTMWGWIAYDPDLNLVYYGTANPGPWNQEQRPGDNKWTATLFARNPDTGAAKWALQYNPHDEHDYDGINEQILVDMTVDGKPRKVLASRPQRTSLCGGPHQRRDSFG